MKAYKPRARGAVRAGVLALMLATTPLAFAQAGPAADLITSMSAQAIAALQKQGESLSARESALRPVLRKSFDMARIARFVAGRYWKTASEDQRREYTAAFSDFVLATYARRLGGYAGEKLEVISERQASKKDSLVQTRIVNARGGPHIEAEWRVRNSGENDQRIIDVAVEGVSMAVTQRQDFASVIRRDGFDGLINVLRARSGRHGVHQ